MNLQTKDFVLSVKEVSDAGAFEGYASTFGGAPDSYGDVVAPGAFVDCLVKHKREETMPLMFFGHKSNELPIGHWVDMAEDGKGLWVKGEVALDDPVGVRVHAALKKKRVRGLSIGYDVPPGGSVPDEKRPAVTILKKLDLWEVSVVNFPANRRSLVDSVKSDGEVQSIQFWKRFEDWARRVGDGEVPPPNEFEELLRDARISKSQRARIASRLHAVLRSESGGEEANAPAVKTALAEFRHALDGFTSPRL